ncbi:ABC transporter ATP-binding protein [Bacillus sp. Hm123]|uniref:ABC transporter ATP-binding protein n=1 Tax=Bacillus sp. Hm123 TaxID=3450745 RepID=UPI003F4397C0
MEHILEVQHVSKTFKNFYLDDVSLSIRKGFIMGFIGPNGAGKSTLIKCMMDFIPYEQGTIKLFGKTHEEATREIKDRIGFVADENIYFDHLTIEANKKLVAPFYSQWSDSSFYAYLDKFGLNRKQKVKSLSKGMKMKMALAFALSHEAELIIMDEPTAGLDPVFRRELLDILLEVIQDENKAIFFSTHITTDLESIADYIAMINNGRIVFSKEKDELLDHFQIVKGPTEIVDEVKSHLIHVRKTAVGFEALTEKGALLREQYGDHFSFEKPTLDQIMYFFVKEKAQ